MTLIIVIVSTMLLVLLILFSVEYTFYKDCLNEEKLCVSIKYKVLKDKIINIINKTELNKIEKLEYGKIDIDNIMFLTDGQIKFYINHSNHSWISVKISFWDYILYLILLKRLVRNLKNTKLNKSNEKYISFFYDSNDNTDNNIKQNDFDKDTNEDEVIPVGFKVEKSINN